MAEVNATSNVKAVLYHKGKIAGHVEVSDPPPQVVIGAASGLVFNLDRRLGREASERKVHGAEFRYDSVSFDIISAPDTTNCDLCNQPISTKPFHHGAAVMCASCYSKGKEAHEQALQLHNISKLRKMCNFDGVRFGGK